MSIETRLLVNIIEGLLNPDPKSNKNKLPPAACDLNDAARSLFLGLLFYDLSFDDCSWVEKPRGCFG
jgi:hypothetical protein